MARLSAVLISIKTISSGKAVSFAAVSHGSRTPGVRRGLKAVAPRPSTKHFKLTHCLKSVCVTHGRKVICGKRWDNYLVITS